MLSALPQKIIIFILLSIFSVTVLASYTNELGKKEKNNLKYYTCLFLINSHIRHECESIVFQKKKKHFVWQHQHVLVFVCTQVPYAAERFIMSQTTTSNKVPVSIQVYCTCIHTHVWHNIVLFNNFDFPRLFCKFFVPPFLLPKRQLYIVRFSFALLLFKTINHFFILVL